jgi:hypothetical protein
MGRRPWGSLLRLREKQAERHDAISTYQIGTPLHSPTRSKWSRMITAVASRSELSSFNCCILLTLQLWNYTDFLLDLFDHSLLSLL